MNNKGQSLVVFVIILPIILIMLTAIIDLGFLYIEKRDISNTLYDSVEYYLNNIEDIDVDIKVREILNKNISNIDSINIVNDDIYVEITIVKIRKSIYSIISNNNEISITYKGIKESKEIIKG